MAAARSIIVLLTIIITGPRLTGLRVFVFVHVNWCVCVCEALLLWSMTAPIPKSTAWESALQCSFSSSSCLHLCMTCELSVLYSRRF